MNVWCMSVNLYPPNCLLFGCVKKCIHRTWLCCRLALLGERGPHPLRYKNCSAVLIQPPTRSRTLTPPPTHARSHTSKTPKSPPAAGQRAAQTPLAHYKPPAKPAASQLKRPAHPPHAPPRPSPDTTPRRLLNCGICIRAKGTLSDSIPRPSCNHFAVRGNLAVSTTVPTANPLDDAHVPTPLSTARTCIYCMYLSALFRSPAAPIAAHLHLHRQE